MDGEQSVSTPGKVLKQMSITRKDLERSSERLANDLSRLQQDNAKQQKIIEDTLSEVQQEQTSNELLLHSDWSAQSLDHNGMPNNGTLKKTLRREPTIVRQLRQWTTSDVIRWLEKEDLHKFILTFQRHHVKGEDLAEIRLPFLDNYEHLSVQDKELLLSHVYELLRLESEDPHAMEHFTSELDREKYMAARQISKDGRGSPIIFVPSHNASPTSSVLSSPMAKLRKCSEPSLQKDLPSGLRQRKVKTLEKPPRKKKPMTNSSSLFDLLGGHNKQEVKCACILKHADQFGLNLQRSSAGDLLISKTDNSHAYLIGCRVMELNGYLPSQLVEGNILQDILRDSQELYIVAVQDLGAMTEEDRWDRLRTVLSDWRDKDLDPSDLTSDISVEDMEGLKDKYSLQDNLVKAREENENLKQKVSELSEELKLQTKLVSDMKEQRDSALRANVNQRLKRNDSGETEYYKMTMESLNVENATKEQVTDSLKEIVKEASRQKFYLDRLISVVIEESPWILDQVDADFDDSSLVNQNEEFC